MNKNINESLKFLIKEYNRLKLKKESEDITAEEKEVLKKLASFIGRDENE